jgi:hypothetical protein
MKRSSYPRPVTRSLKVAAVVSVAMVAVIYAALQRGRTVRATRALNALPSTARAVLRIDPPAVRRSAAARSLVDAFVGADRLSEIEATCGLDPMSDLSEATIWVRGSESQPFQSFGLMLTGRRVDAAGLAECHKLLVEARGGSVVRLEAPTGPVLASDDHRSAIALLDGRTVVTGSVRTVAEAMAVHRGLLPTLGDRAPIAALWPEISPDAAIAAALDPPGHWKTALERAAAFDAEESALQGIEAVGLAVKLGSGRATELVLDVATPELANESAALIRAWAASPPPDVEAPWDAILQTARVTIEGRRIRIAVDVSSLPTTP